MPSRNLPFSSYAVKILIPLIFMIDDFFFVEQTFIRGTLAVTQIFNARAHARVIIYPKRGLKTRTFWQPHGLIIGLLVLFIFLG